MWSEGGFLTVSSPQVSACSPGTGSPEGRPGGVAAWEGSHREAGAETQRGTVKVQRAEPGNEVGRGVLWGLLGGGGRACVQLKSHVKECQQVLAP